MKNKLLPKIPLKITVTSIGLMNLALILEAVRSDIQKLHSKDRKLKKECMNTLNGCLHMIQNTLDNA